MTTTQQEILSHARLHLQAATTDLDDCWAEGYESAHSHQSENNNPYAQDSAEYEQWSEGWWAGFYGEAPIYDYIDQAGNLAISEGAVAEVFDRDAANESIWTSERFDKWVGRVLKISGALLATVAIHELAEMVG